MHARGGSGYLCLVSRARLHIHGFKCCYSKQFVSRTAAKARPHLGPVESPQDLSHPETQQSGWKEARPSVSITIPYGRNKNPCMQRGQRLALHPPTLAPPRPPMGLVIYPVHRLASNRPVQITTSEPRPLCRNEMCWRIWKHPTCSAERMHSPPNRLRRDGRTLKGILSPHRPPSFVPPPHYAQDALPDPRSLVASRSRVRSWPSSGASTQLQGDCLRAL